MRTLKNKSLYTLFIALLMSGSLFFSSCTEDDSVTFTEEDKKIILSFIKENREYIFDMDYSYVVQQFFLSWWARSAGEESISIILDDPEGDGVSGTDVPLTDKDDIQFTDKDGKMHKLSKGSYTMDAKSEKGMIKGEDENGEAFEIEIK